MASTSVQTMMTASPKKAASPCSFTPSPVPACKDAKPALPDPLKQEPAPLLLAHGDDATPHEWWSLGELMRIMSPDNLEAYIEERITTSNYKVTDCGMLLWVPSAKAAAQYMAHARAKAKAVAPPPKAPNATTACKTEVQASLPCPPKPSSNVQAPAAFPKTPGMLARPSLPPVPAKAVPTQSPGQIAQVSACAAGSQASCSGQAPTSAPMTSQAAKTEDAHGTMPSKVEPPNLAEPMATSTNEAAAAAAAVQPDTVVTTAVALADHAHEQQLTTSTDAAAAAAAKPDTAVTPADAPADHAHEQQQLATSTDAAAAKPDTVVTAAVASADHANQQQLEYACSSSQA